MLRSGWISHNGPPKRCHLYNSGLGR